MNPHEFFSSPYIYKIRGRNNYFIGRSMAVFIARLLKSLNDVPVISITNVYESCFKLAVGEQKNAG